jgi:hypothetical protein
MKTTWLDEEAGVTDALRQTARLLVGGLRRPWISLAFALALALAVGGFLAFGKRTYDPRLVLRLVEGAGATTTPNLKRRLADYVRDGIFTSQPLGELVRRHGLYPSLARNNPRAAIESFREDIHVEVYQNYFVEERSAGDAPRSARVAVSYRANDRETALAVTRDLGALIVSHEGVVRRAQAERAAREAEFARDTLQVALQRRTREIAEIQQEIVQGDAGVPERQVELVGMLGSLSPLERELDEATRRAASYELGAALEQGGVGLRFEIADDASLPSGAARTRWAALAAVGSFVLGLPLAALAVGAFSPGRRA